MGGNVAENAGGAGVSQYGVTRDWTLGMTVTLMGGETLRLGRRTPKGVTGYDLTALFVGSEGTFGVTSEITVRLVGRPEGVGTFIAVMPDAVSAGRAVSEIIRKGQAIRNLAKHVEGGQQHGDYVLLRMATLRRQRRQDLHHQRRPRRLRHHRRPHRGPGPCRGQPARRREGHARLHRRPLAGEDGLALLRHRRAVVRRRARAGRQPRRRGERRLLPDRRAVRGRADRARGARLRDRSPVAGARPRRTAGSARPSASH